LLAEPSYLSCLARLKVQTLVPKDPHVVVHPQLL
jgi:hypothetical protein